MKKTFSPALLLCFFFIQAKEDGNELNNGHAFLNELEQSDFYIGQPKNKLIAQFGEPLKLTNNTLLFVQSERKIYPLVPFKGRSINGLIIVVKLDKENRVESIKKVKYTQNSNVAKAKTKLKELEANKKTVVARIKTMEETFKKTEKERLLAIEKKKKDLKKITLKK